MRATVALLLAFTSTAFAQDADKTRDALEWTVALRGRMAQMSSPVVRVHGIASVARVVCPLDPVTASGLFQDAITSLFNVPGSAFGERGTTVLPVASFSGLWKYVVPAALKCDPNLASAAKNQQARERLDAERAAANATLSRAYGLIGSTLDKADMLDRAAQVAAGALEAGDPDTFDTAQLSSFLSRLNARAPELADDLFQRSLDFVLSAPIPSPDSLQDLAKFLLTASDLVNQSDEDQPNKNFQVGGATVEDLSAPRATTNPDNIEALIESTFKLLVGSRRGEPQSGGRLCPGLPVAAAGARSHARPRHRARSRPGGNGAGVPRRRNPGSIRPRCAAESQPGQRRSRGAQFLARRADSRRRRSRDNSIVPASY